MQEIQWRYYPHVAEHPITRAFIESQSKRQKRPKTIDAYARNLEDLLRAFAEFGNANLIEAGPDLLEDYIDNLYHRAPARIRNKITSQPVSFMTSASTEDTGRTRRIPSHVEVLGMEICHPEKE